MPGEVADAQPDHVMVTDGSIRDPSQRVENRPAAEATVEWRGAEQRLDRGLRDELRFGAPLGDAPAARLGAIARVHDEAQDDHRNQTHRGRDHEQAKGRPRQRGHLSWSSGTPPT